MGRAGLAKDTGVMVTLANVATLHLLFVGLGFVCTVQLAITLSVTTESPEVAETVQLYRQPVGPVLEGDTINIICHVRDKHLLDIVRLLRHPLNNDTRLSHVITTNDVIEGDFKVISRYKVIRWDEGQGLIQLQIAGKTPVMGN